MQLGSRGIVISLPQQVQGSAVLGGLGKFDFYCPKGQRMTYYLFIFYVKFSAVRGIFVLIRAREIITIREFLVSCKIFVRETLNLSRESRITNR